MTQRQFASLMAVAVSGFVCASAFVPIGASYLVIVGIAALLVLLQWWPIAQGSRRFTLLAGFIFGVSFMGQLIWWMNAIGPGAYIALVLVQALFFAPAVLALRAALKLPWPIVWATGVWVLFEYLRSTFPFSGFPWGRLAYPMADTPLASFARLLGIPAMSAIIFALACALASVAVARTRRAGLVTAAVFAVVFSVASVLPMGIAGPGGTAKVALVQGNVPGLFGTWEYGEIFQLHLDQTEELARAVEAGLQPRPDMVLWPENGTDVDPYDRPSAARKIEELSARIGAPILIGAILNGPTSQTAYNAGIVWDAFGPGERYVKRKLVPYGEYVPFRQAIGSIVPRFAREIPRDMIPGTKNGALQINGITIGDTICWDIAYDGVVRDAMRAGAEVLVVQTSNASFTGTAQPEQQWQISKLRAIATGRTVLVPSTNGITGIANAAGETVARAPTRESATLTATVPLGHELTFGVRWGGIVQGILAALGALGLVVSGFAVNRRKHRESIERRIGHHSDLQ